MWITIFEFSKRMFSNDPASALFSFLSECGGTHIIPPRTWALHAKLHF